MPKITVCVLKTVKFFDHFEVEADNDLDARRMALAEVRRREKQDDDKILWDCDKPIYSAEVVK